MIARRAWLLPPGVRAVGLLLLLASCSGDRAALAGRRHAAAAGLEDDPAVAAAAAQVDAAAAESGPGIVDELELRLRSRLGEAAAAPAGSPAEDATGGLEVGARLPMKSPLAVAASSRAREAGVELAVAELEGVALERRGELCSAAIAHQAHVERRALYDGFAARLRSLLAWNQEWSRAGSLDELSAARLDLDGKRLLSSREPRPVPEELPAAASVAAFPLPALSAASGKLRTGSAEVVAQLGKSSPAAAARRAAWARYQALSAEAFHAALPWLSFVELGVTPSAVSIGESLAGRIGVAIPLGVERGEATRLEAEAVSEDRSRQAEEAVALRQVQVALEELSLFEAKASRLAELAATAVEAERIADRWFQERREEPAKVAALFEQSFEARADVITARELAGQAGCALLGLTGVSPAAWPRQGVEQER